MQVRSFRLPGASTLETVRARAAAAVADWAAQWGLGPEACAVSCARPEGDLAGVAWDGTWRAGVRQCWLAFPPSLEQALRQAMFGREAGHAGAAASAPLAALAAARAQDALGAALAAGLLGEEGGQPARPDLAAQPAPQLLAPGAGALCLTVSVGAAGLRVLLDGASVAALAPPRPAQQPALAPLKLFKALASTPVRLPVRLGQAELGLGALMSVAVGDVIRLERAVDAPVEVLAPQGGALFRAYLGQMQGMVAIDIDGRH